MSSDQCFLETFCLVDWRLVKAIGRFMSTPPNTCFDDGSVVMLVGVLKGLGLRLTVAVADILEKDLRLQSIFLAFTSIDVVVVPPD